MDTRLEALRDAANVPLTDPEKNRNIGDGVPRFELYHFAMSLCSQKVRTTLAEVGASYIGHDVNIQPGNYHPDYIRLRLEAQAGAKFATGYTGRSSVTTEGFDPAVVPTLIDLDASLVVADSAAICRYISDFYGDVYPEPHRAAIDREMARVDATPHVPMLYGAHPDGDFRPERLQGGMAGVHDRKIAKLEAARPPRGEDPALDAAYDAKIAKEAAGRDFVHDDDSMRASVTEMVQIVADLDDRLSDGRANLVGDQFTLADVVWAVSLLRMKWIGMDFVWTGSHALNATPRPHAERYALSLMSRPSVRAACIDWPGMPRSEFVEDLYN